MHIKSYFFIVSFLSGVINIVDTSFVFPMQQSDQISEKSISEPTGKPAEQLQAQKPEQPACNKEIEAAVEKVLVHVLNRVKQVRDIADGGVLKSNESLALAHSANATSIDSCQKSKEALSLAQQASDLLNKLTIETQRLENVNEKVGEQASEASKNLQQEYERLCQALIDQSIKEAQKISEATQKNDESNLENEIKKIQAKIDKKQECGIYEQMGKVMAQAEIDANIGAEKEKWKNVREIINDSSPMIKIATAIIVVALCVYIIKYGTPAIINYWMRPRVISETSRPGLFEWFTPREKVDIEDLIFAPALQKQLLALLLRVQSAKNYGDSLPNVLFHGVPGTGKTAFIKALAYSSGLDYALTSGSEFAKIPNLNDANNEFRKLLSWAKRSKNGLIVFIDEAESLFANRKLQTTSKATQDFINTFLSLVSDQSQKNLMFIFATNHPFKIDDAVINRVGINIEFTLPKTAERAKILMMYILKFARENKKAEVELHPDLNKMIVKYADRLDGFSPRTIKFMAEEMVVNARRHVPMKLTEDIVQTVIDDAKNSLRQSVEWQKECAKWGKV